VRAQVSWVPRPAKASEFWAQLSDSLRHEDLRRRFAELAPDLAGLPADEVAQGISLAASVIDDGIDHLHAHFASLAGRMAWLASRLTGVPYTITTHAKDIYHESVDRGWLRRICGDADRVIAISRFNERYLNEVLDGTGARISLQYNALELERFPYRDPIQPSLPLRIATVGRLVPKKGFADLIDASSKSAARMALRSLKGAFSQHIHELVDDLITLRMLVEATLDFPEEDIDFLEAADARGKLQALQGRLKTVLASAEQGAILREGMNVVLVGAPNVGKSSLLNALAGDDIAIVTDIAGTTRDTVREQITLDGVPVHIIDTAGLRETDDVVEQIGIERSRKAVSEADVALILIDPREGVNAKTQAILNSLPEGLKKIEIHNKADLTGEPVAVRSDSLAQTGADTIISLSAKTGTGLDLLKHALLQEVGWQGESESLFLARSRHLNALHEAEAELENAALCDNNQIELFAEHLRLAQNACSEITGEFTADDLLGVIFSRFCIGK